MKISSQHGSLTRFLLIFLIFWSYSLSREVTIISWFTQEMEFRLDQSTILSVVNKCCGWLIAGNNQENNILFLSVFASKIGSRLKLALYWLSGKFYCWVHTNSWNAWTRSVYDYQLCQHTTGDLANLTVIYHSLLSPAACAVSAFFIIYARVLMLGCCHTVNE